MDFPISTPQNAAAAAFVNRKVHRHLIGGEWVESLSGDYFDTLDPATGRLIGQIARGNAAEVDAAVLAARKAFEGGTWPKMLPIERSKLLWTIADKLEENIDELAELETLDQGKALYVGRWAEIPGAINQFRYFSGLATKIEGSTIPTSINYQPEGKEVFAYTQHLPVGVVGAIVPWNSPLVLTAMKLAPALAAGCTVVLKPAEDTSLTAVRLLELMQEAGLPEGVVAQPVKSTAKGKQAKSVKLALKRKEGNGKPFKKSFWGMKNILVWMCWFLFAENLEKIDSCQSNYQRQASGGLE